jgi:hypothetical protein
MTSKRSMEEIQATATEMVRLRREGWTLSAIAKLFELHGQTVYQNIKKVAPDLITGKAMHHPRTQETSKLKLVVSKKSSWKPPKTGSASGFIRALPLSKLTSRKAGP